MNLRMESNTEVIHSLGGGNYIPDMDWEYTDGKGHEHKYEMHKKLPRILTASLVQIEDNWIDVDGEEWNGETEYQCNLCGEIIEPETKWQSGPSYIQHPTYYIDEVEVSEEEFLVAYGTGLEEMGYIRTGENEWTKANKL